MHAHTHLYISFLSIRQIIFLVSISGLRIPQELIGYNWKHGTVCIVSPFRPEGTKLKHNHFSLQNGPVQVKQESNNNLVQLNTRHPEKPSTLRSMLLTPTISLLHYQRKTLYFKNNFMTGDFAIFVRFTCFSFDKPRRKSWEMVAKNSTVLFLWQRLCPP